jgi:hypothetical protein
MAAKNQGIMALEADMPKPPKMKGGEPPAPQISPLESYDAITTGLSNSRPDVSMELNDVLSGITPDFDQVSDEMLDVLIQVFQQLFDQKDRYKELVAKVVASDLFDEGDLPEEYDAEFLSTFLSAVLHAKQARTTSIPNEPVLPANFARGGIAEAARLVASKGRYGDTMLAHINPQEAAILKALGGSGTINPRTGLREYFLDFIGDALGGVVDALGSVAGSVLNGIKSVVKSVGSAVKSVLASPVGRIAATIALSVALGPAGFGIANATWAPVLASMGTTAFSGGNVKDILVAGATSYFGSPDSPLSSYVNGATKTLVSNEVARNMLNSTIVGTGINLATGQKFSDAVKGGLTSAVIDQGSKYLSGNLSKGKPETIESVIEDNAVNKANDVQFDQQAKLRALEDPSAGELSYTGTGPKPGGDPLNYSGPNIAEQNKFGIMGTPEAANAVSSSGANYGAASDALGAGPYADTNFRYYDADGNVIGAPTTAASAGAPAGANAPAGAYQPPKTIGQNLKDIGGGIMDVATGEFKQGYDKVSGGIGDLMMPSSPTTEQLTNSDAFKNAIANKASYSEALDAATQAAGAPGLLRTYGPSAAAALGVGAAAGMFDAPPLPPSPLKEKLSGTPGEDLIAKNPDKYVMQNLPGVEYDAAGNITGYTKNPTAATMEDIRVPTASVNFDTSGSRSDLSNPTVATSSLSGGIAPPTYNTNPFEPYDWQKELMQYYTPQPMQAAMGGIASLAQGGHPKQMSQYPRRTGQIAGPGTETSDSIPAMLSDGEFVMTARAVRGLGGGSRKAGAQKMYALMHQLERNAARG